MEQLTLPIDTAANSLYESSSDAVITAQSINCSTEPIIKIEIPPTVVELPAELAIPNETTVSSATTPYTEQTHAIDAGKALKPRTETAEFDESIRSPPIVTGPFVEHMDNIPRAFTGIPAPVIAHIVVPATLHYDDETHFIATAQPIETHAEMISYDEMPSPSHQVPATSCTEDMEVITDEYTPDNVMVYQADDIPAIPGSVWDVPFTPGISAPAPSFMPGPLPPSSPLNDGYLHPQIEQLADVDIIKSDHVEVVHTTMNMPVSPVDTAVGHNFGAYIVSSCNIVADCRY